MAKEKSLTKTPNRNKIDKAEKAGWLIQHSAEINLILRIINAVLSILHQRQ